MVPEEYIFILGVAIKKNTHSLTLILQPLFITDLYQTLAYIPEMNYVAGQVIYFFREFMDIFVKNVWDLKNNMHNIPCSLFLPPATPVFKHKITRCTK